MAPKEPTRQQLSSRLAYNQDTPAFLQRLRNKVSGVSNGEEEDFDEWQAASGRPPIPRRPSPPQRPTDDPGSASEDETDEKPQVVVLREGKHLTAHEAEKYAENERRRARRLPPLPDDSKDKEDKGESGKNGSASKNSQKSDGKDANPRLASLSFSSSGVAPNTKGSAKKRKVAGDDLDELLVKEKTQKVQKKGKKVPKAKKVKTGTLLSFGEDDG